MGHGRLGFSISQKVILLSLALLLITSFILGGIFLNTGTDVLVDRTFESIGQRIQDKGEDLKNRFALVRDDVRLLANLEETKSLLKAEEQGLSEEELEPLRLELQHEFGVILNIKPSYLHLRYIRANGDEIVRVDRSTRESDIITIPKGDLQNKAHRDYFQDAIAQPADTILIGDVDLNKEHGKVVVPHQVVVRFSTPLFYPTSGKLAGIVIINYEMGEDLESIQRSLTQGRQQMFITNFEGDYLYHPDENKRFGFVLGQRHLIQNDLPETKHIFFAHNHDYHSFLSSKDQHAYMYVFGQVDFDPDDPDRFLVVGIQEDHDQLISTQQSRLAGPLLWMILVALAAGLIMLFVVRYLLSPIHQVTEAIEHYGNTHSSLKELPVTRNDDAGVLARSFVTMVEKIDDTKNELRDLNSNLENIVGERTRKLHDSERLQRAILSTMQDGVLTTDFSGTVKGANLAAQKMFGYTEEEMLGQNMTAYVTGLNEDETVLYQESWHEDYRRGHKRDGSAFPVEVLINEGEYDEEPLYTAVIRDVTERLKADKLKAEFVSTVSHELRTPLTAMKGSLDLMSSGQIAVLPDATKPLMDIARSNASRLLLLINDILDMQKIAEGKMSYHFTPQSVSSLLKQAVASNQAYADQFNVTYEITSDLPEEVLVSADNNRLMQVMSNLMSNAAKFSHEGGVVEIAASTEEEQVRISVIDHGCGIPAEFHDRMFTKFAQADSSDTRQKGGSGLGLVITRSIVEDHKGEISFESQEGEGTTFYITLPIAANLQPA